METTRKKSTYYAQHGCMLPSIPAKPQYKKQHGYIRAFIPPEPHLSCSPLGLVALADEQPPLRTKPYADFGRRLMIDEIRREGGCLYIDMHRHCSINSSSLVLSLYGHTPEKIITHGKDPIFLQKTKIKLPLYLITPVGTALAQENIAKPGMHDVMCYFRKTIEDLKSVRAEAKQNKKQLTISALQAQQLSHYRMYALALLSHVLIKNKWQDVWELVTLAGFNKLRLIHWNEYTQHDPE